MKTLWTDSTAPSSANCSLWTPAAMNSRSVLNDKGRGSSASTNTLLLSSRMLAQDLYGAFTIWPSHWNCIKSVASEKPGLVCSSQSGFSKHPNQVNTLICLFLVSQIVPKTSNHPNQHDIIHIIMHTVSVVHQTAAFSWYRCLSVPTLSHHTGREPLYKMQKDKCFTLTDQHALQLHDIGVWKTVTANFYKLIGY